MGAWNWLDWAFAIITTASVIVAVRKGFLRELISLAAVIVGLVVAAVEYPRAGGWFRHFTESRHLALAAGFFTVFALVMAAGAVVSWAARLLMQKAGIGWADRLLGGAFGLIRGLVFDSILLMIFIALAIQPQAVRNSQLAPYVSTGTCAIMSLLPERLRSSFEGELELLRRAVADGAKSSSERRGPA